MPSTQWTADDSSKGCTPQPLSRSSISGGRDRRICRQQWRSSMHHGWRTSPPLRREKHGWWVFEWLSQSCRSPSPGPPVCADDRKARHFHEPACPRDWGWCPGTDRPSDSWDRRRPQSRHGISDWALLEQRSRSLDSQSWS